MKLSTDAKIFTEDGQEIGHLDRFVIDPKTKRVTHIVFERGLLEKRDHVIPMTLVDHVDNTGIHLMQLPVSDPDDLTLFKEDDYVITDEHALLDQGVVSDTMVRNYYYYPTLPFGAAGMMRPFETYADIPAETAPTPSHLGIPISGEEPIVDEVKENIPDNTVALKEGAKVLSKDEKHLGNVDKVIADTQSEIASHFIISKGLLLKERKLIPMDWVDTFDEDHVYLSVNAGVVERVPAYKENK